jgi:hypothetical protein
MGEGIRMYLLLDHSGQQIAIVTNKQRSQRFDMERFNLKMLNDVEGKEQFHVEVSKRFTALEIWTHRWKLIVSGKRLERI